jgi:hypothetical protein
MRNRKWILNLILVLGLALTLAACGGEPEPAAPEASPQAPESSPQSPAAQPTTAPAAEPTNTPIPTAPPAPTAASVEDLDLGNLADLSDLSSYRSSMRVAVSGTTAGEPVDDAIDLVVEYTADPPAQRIVMSGAGFDETEGMDSIEMYQVENMTYMKLGEEWLSMPSTEAIGADAMVINPDDVLGDTCGWESQGRAEYEGVDAYHWTLSQDDLEACMTAEDLAEIGDIDEASGDLYVAVEGNYILYMNVAFAGANLNANLGSETETLEQGRMEITFEMTDVNVPFTIEVPEEAAASGGLPEDLPAPDDAQDVASMFGMITFNSPSTPQQVAEFYQAQMPANGWTETSFEEMSGLYMLEYTKDTRTASLMINTDDETGLTSVLITISDSTDE